MATTTVVDQLIVKLGLDPRDFTKGEKEVAADVLRAKENVRKGADDMSKSMTSAARSFGNSGGIIAKVFGKGGAVGLALAVTIAAGKKINDLLYDVAVNTRRLGIDARNFNTTAAGLRNMQNAAELAGGSIEDANQSVGGLAKSLYDAKFNGQISDSLIMLGRLGVRFEDATGKARRFEDVALDTADALDKAQKSGMMSRSEAVFAAQQAGLTGGLANLAADGRGALAAALARQQARRQVNGEDVNAATNRVNAYLSLGQAAESNVGVPSMTKESPAMTALSAKTEQAVTHGLDAVSTASDKASMALGDLADDVKAASRAMSLNPNNATPSALRVWMSKNSINVAADKYGIPRAVLQGIARTESNYNPKAEARNANGVVTGRGIMQLNPKFFPNAGQNESADIDTAARLYANLYSRTQGTEQERHIAALRMYHAGETNYRNGTNLGPENRAYAGKVLAGTSLALPTPGMQGGGPSNHTTVTFEEINVNTPRTDGRAVADEVVDGARRKLMASHSDTGMQ